MHFVNRGDLIGADFTDANLLQNGTIQSLSLIGIIPNNNRKKQALVKVSVQIQGDGENQGELQLNFFKHGITNYHFNSLGTTQGISIYVDGQAQGQYYFYGFVDIGNDLLIDYRSFQHNVGTAIIHINILGWNEDCFGL